MQTSDFDYAVPSELVAQEPAAERDQSRLLVLSRSTAQIRHRHFRDLEEYLRPGDLLILNNTQVFKARLWATKDVGNAEVEMLLFEESASNVWWTLFRPGKRIRIGTHLILRSTSRERTEIRVDVLRKTSDGHYLVAFSGIGDIKEHLDELGEIPLPPYITRKPLTAPMNDCERYQTVYAERPGSVAAPTAGLHFTDRLLSRIQSKSIQISYLTLHVGLGTFASVKTESLENHVMHEEAFELTSGTAEAIQNTRQSGGRIIAVGTTTVRVLETIAAAHDGTVRPLSGRTGIYIYPPYQFRIVDALLTNFHLPRSTLLMLASAFAAPGELRGRDMILSAYSEAIRERYRFFSYGDAMLIL